MFNFKEIGTEKRRLHRSKWAFEYRIDTESGHFNIYEDSFLINTYANNCTLNKYTNTPNNAEHF